MLFSRKQEISLPLSLLLSPSLPSSILSLRFSSLSTRIAIGARGYIHPTPEFTHLSTCLELNLNLSVLHSIELIHSYERQKCVS